MIHLLVVDVQNESSKSSKSTKYLDTKKKYKKSAFNVLPDKIYFIKIKVHMWKFL